MTDDVTTEIEEFLATELSEPPDSSADLYTQRQQKMLRLLTEAADELGESPSLEKYNDLDYDISGDAIKNAFGSWNAAKEAADLEKLGRGGAYVQIDQSYFKDIDSDATAYWFGTLIAHSSLSEQELSGKYALSVNRTVSERYFVTGLSDAIDSEYSITEVEIADAQNRVQTLISNPEFITNLIKSGYPLPGQDPSDFPPVDEFRAPFVRGFLESSGYFSTGGWNVNFHSRGRAETLQEWFEEFGAKRPTISEQQDGFFCVRVSNIFDITSVYETCWPDGLTTTPSYTPYARKVLEYIEAEHPYPENVELLADL